VRERDERRAMRALWSIYCLQRITIAICSQQRQAIVLRNVLTVDWLRTLRLRACFRTANTNGRCMSILIPMCLGYPSGVLTIFRSEFCEHLSFLPSVLYALLISPAFIRSLGSCRFLLSAPSVYALSLEQPITSHYTLNYASSRRL